MPIPLPNLDDRRWADLVEQGRALIPLYSPEWTDHNASDPGITLMELLAWIAEMDVYRLNRITARQKRRLLQLLQIRPAPPQPSTLVAELRIATGTPPVHLPASLEFAGSRLDGSAITFRSETAVDVIASELRAIQRRDAAGFQNATAAWTREQAMPVFGTDPSNGAELYLGFESPLPTDAWTHVYVVLEGERTGLEERRQILKDKKTDTLPRHHSARIVWEYLPDAGGTARWQPLESDDHTRSFTLTGAVRLRPGSAMKAQALGSVGQSLYYVRGRVAGGSFDEAPRVARLFVNAVQLVQSTPVWQTWPIAAGATISGTPVPGQPTGLHLEVRQGTISKLVVSPVSNDGPRFAVLDYAAPTSVAAGRLTFEGALTGVGTGAPEQTITVDRRPLVEHTFGLFSLEEGSWRRWERVDDFAASARSSAHFLLDPTTGDVTFGNGEKGRTPPAGALLFAFYDATQADAGLGRVSGVADSPRNRVLLSDPGVSARVTAGSQALIEVGRAAETLAHAIGRAIESRNARVRAVTVEDFEAIARETPGTRIARAVARPNLYPGLDCVSAPGVVTVIVLPSLPSARPVPSPGLLAEIAARLERRRTIGTRVIVTGPRYLEVAVRARLRAFDGVDRARLMRQLADRLDAFFHPLNGGPERLGWPLGRDIYRAEVMQVIDETPGVDHVLSLELQAEGCGPICGNVCLRPTWLVAAGQHAIEVL